MSRNRLWFNVVQIFLMGFFLSLLLALFPRFQETMDSNMELVRTELLDYFQNRLGLEIQYSSLSPSFLLYLEVRDLRITRPGDEQASITINRLNIYYNIFQLFSGDPLKIIREVRILNSRLSVHHLHDAPWIERFTEALQSNSTDSQPGASLPGITLSGRNLSLEWIGAQETLNLNRVNFDLNRGSTSFAFRLRTETQGTLTRADFPLERFQGNLDLQGTLNPDFAAGLFTMRFRNFDSNIVQMNDQNFQILFDDSRVNIRKVQDRTPLDLEVNWDRPSQTLAVEARSQDLRPRDLFVFSGSWASANTWLQSQITATWGFDLGPENQISYHFDGNLTLMASGLLRNTRIQGRFRGNENLARIQELSLRGSYGALSYSGTWDFQKYHPDGILNLNRLTYGDFPPLSTMIRFRSVGQSQVDFLAPQLQLQETVFSSLRGRFFTPEGPEGLWQWDLDAILEAPNDRESGRLALQGNYDGLSQEIDLLSSWEYIPLSELAFLGNRIVGDGWDWESLLANLRLDTALTVNSSPQGGFRLDTQLFRLVDESQSARRLQFSYSQVNATGRVNDLFALWEDILITGDLDFDLSSANDSRVNLELALGDHEYSLGARMDQVQRTVEVNGNYGLSADLRWLDEQEWELIFATQNLPLPLLSEQITLSTESVFRMNTLTSNWYWELDHMNFQTNELAFLEQVSLELQGYLSSRGGNLETVQFSDRWSTLEGSARIGSLVQWQDTLSGVLELRNPDREEYYFAQLVRSNGEDTWELEWDNSLLERIRIPGARGKMGGNLIMDSQSGVFTALGNLNLSDAYVNSDPLALDARFSLDDQQLSLDTLDFRLGQLFFRQSQGQYILETGTFSLGSRLLYRIGTDEITSRVNIQASVTEGLTIGSIDTLAETRVQGSVDLRELVIAGNREDNLRVDFNHINGLTTFRGGPEQSLSGRIQQNGVFRVLLSEPLPLRMNLQGRIMDNQIQASADSLLLDIPVLSRFLDREVFDLLDGQLEGNLRLTGPINDPEFQGNLSMNSIRARLGLLSQELGPFSGTWELAGNRIFLSDTVVPVGSDPVLVTSSLQLENWNISRYRLQITATDNTPISLDSDFGGLLVRGQASGFLEISGDSLGFQLQGDVLVQDTLITLSTEPPEATPPGELGFQMDLRITTGNRVEFQWPLQAFPVLKAFALPGQSLRLTLDDRMGTFSLVGGVQIRGGEINYFNSTFYLREGALVFNENENRFDPLLNLRAELRRREAEGNLIIYLIVNDFLSRFSPTFESLPSRPTEEILAILGATFLPVEELLNPDFGTALGLAADLGTSFLLRPFEDRVKSVFNLDLFSFRTEIIRRALLGGQDGNPVTLEDYLDNTSLFLGKYLGDDLFLEGLIRLDSDSPDTGNPDLSAEVEFGLEMQTPFFQINWRLTPQNPDRLFLPDNTVAFTWRFNF